MIDNFLLYFKMGLFHVLDFSGLDHILFLIVLTVVFSFHQWKKVLWLITFFTIGHTLSLTLAAYGVVNVNMKIVEFLIPMTILITAVFNILRAKKASSGKENINLIFALFFGLIHGLGFSSYFRMMVTKSESKLLPLLEFALGIEAAQLIIVLVILLLAVIFINLFRVSKRDWILILSSIVIGLVLPMIKNRIFW